MYTRNYLRVTADADVLAVSTLSRSLSTHSNLQRNARKPKHEEICSSLNQSQKRVPRCSSTPTLETAAGRKKLDPLPMERSVKKANDEERCSLLSHSQNKRWQRPLSTGGLEKAIGRKKLDPLPMEPTMPRRSLTRDKLLASLNRDDCVDLGSKSQFRRNLSTVQAKDQLLSTSAEDIRRLQEQLLSRSVEDVSHSRMQSTKAKTSPKQTYGERNAKVDHGDHQLSDGSQIQSPQHTKTEISIKEPISSNPAESKQSHGQESVGFGALQFRRVTRDLNCPLDTIKDARGLFDHHANRDQTRAYLDFQKFSEIVVHILKSTGQILSGEKLKKKIEVSWREADRNFDGTVDWDEFAIWYSSWGFQQEMLLSPQQILSRNFAKKYDLSIADVDSVQAKFKLFDEDGSGEIEFHEFEKLLCKLMKIPRGQELPANRLNHFWKEIDGDGSGSVDFEEFLQWYVRYFDMKGNAEFSPMEQLYQSMRPNLGRPM